MTNTPNPIIVGGGPGGASAAIVLRQLGVPVTLLEPAEFPRLHVGEALVGEARNVLRELGVLDEMDHVSHRVRTGAWIHGVGENRYHFPVMARPEPGVHQPATSFIVDRADFDAMLLDRARETGADVRRARAERPVLDDDGAVVGVEITDLDSGASETLDSSIVVDASGMKAFLHGAGVTPRKTRGPDAHKIAIFAHCVGAVDDTPDQASVCYVGRDRWCWFLPIGDATYSVGFVVPTGEFKAFDGDLPTFFDSCFDGFHPEMTRRLVSAERVTDVYALRDWSYQVTPFSGPGWVCIGDAHRFVDPIFSFGVQFALQEGMRVGAEIAEGLQAGATRLGPFPEFEVWSEHRQQIVQDLTDAFWEHPLGFGYEVTRRNRPDFYDLFAGRFPEVGEASPPGLRSLRRALDRPDVLADAS